MRKRKLENDYSLLKKIKMLVIVIELISSTVHFLRIP